MEGWARAHSSERERMCKLFAKQDATQNKRLCVVVDHLGALVTLLKEDEARVPRHSNKEYDDDNTKPLELCYIDEKYRWWWKLRNQMQSLLCNF